MGSSFGRPYPTRSASTGDENLRTPPSKEMTRSTFSVASSHSRATSSVVKEIEKMRKKREERRARQTEALLGKQEMMSRDVANPNWEFSAMVEDYRHSLEFQPLQPSNEVSPPNRICVCLRKRPLNSKEMSRKDVDVVTSPNKNTIIVHEPKCKVDLTKFLDNHKYRFDFVFNETATNKMVYNYTAKSLIHTIFEGGMATCFAYGQTGSGKTHTMGGDFVGNTQDHSKGIYALTGKQKCEFHGRVVYDLLNDNAKLRILENGNQQIQVVGLVELSVGSVDQILEVIALGSRARSTSQSSCNDHSSRSHAVFQIILRRKEDKKIHGKFSLIDLAGNERGIDTAINHKRRIEGSEINKSLLALKECVRALGRKGAYLPFRASKLTQVLRDSFIGDNIATCMIAMISPGMSTCEQTLNTLRYANRVKELSVEELDLKTSHSNDHINSVNPSGDQDQWWPLGANDAPVPSILISTELPIDIAKLHQTVSELQKLEDEVLDSHRVIQQETLRWLETDQMLLKMTDNAGYDVDVYSDQLDTLVEEKITVLIKFRESISALRKVLTGI